MTKNINVFIFFLCFSFFGFAQNNFTGKVVNLENGFELDNVQIINLKTKDTIFSNEKGFFKVDVFGVYTFQKLGFVDKEINISDASFIIVQLENSAFVLNEIIINSNHLPRKLKKATTTIQVINTKDIERSNTTDFAPILNRVPGIFMQSGSLNTNRITIRGIGSRNLFGTSKIRAYFKDIPLTNGSGETTIEDFELASIASFEIEKGATSSSYGAGLGGTILLKPQNSYFQDSNIATEFSIGDFGLVKGIVNLNLGFKNNSVRAVFSDTKSDGFRNNNEYNRQTFTINSNHYINQKNELTVLASYVDLKAFIPSSINEDDFRNNPEKAAFTWQQSKGFEDANRGILGVTWTYKINDNLEQVTSVFTSFRYALEPRPFNVLQENSFAVGARSRVLGTKKVFNKNMNFTFGAEVFKDIYKVKTFENLYQNFPEGNGSVSGEELSHFKENRTYYNLFLESDYEISSKTTFSVGLNLNQTSYDLKDNFMVSQNNPDQSGDFKFNAILSPKVGLSHLIADNMSVFSSISHGFSPISLAETLLPDGQINTDLKPETGWNFEMGSRGSFLQNKLNYAISLYRLHIKNLVVSRRTAQDEFIGINAGTTRHDGLEMSLDYSIFKNKTVSIHPFLSYSLNNFKFEEFIDGENNFSGNELTGVPKQILNVGFDVTSKVGFYGNINYKFVDKMPITDSNSLYSDAYNITNFKVGYSKNINTDLNFNLFFGLNNIFNEHYASQILINATGFGGVAPRYYYPGNPINYFSGVRLNYNL
ncbi:TonB-dependent receptor family protein [Polaribacter vadi]|uniref:TonB-dependent receptor family protein n=1 Tax=Polaribacter vadi TaxID=1774273 RepID=UPI0030EDC486